MIPLVIAVISANFLLVQAAPGDPALLFVRESGTTAAQLAEIRARLGLDRPLLDQYVAYVASVLRLDLGTSIGYRVPVLDLVLSRLGASLLLAGTGFILSTFLGVALGVLAARSVRPRQGRAINTFALAAYSLPSFWLAQILLLVFALHLRWLPAQGMASLRAPSSGPGVPLDVAAHMILPVLAYAIFPFASVFRLTFGKVQEVLTAEFITAARARGVSERQILFRHALPNSLLPVITVVAANLGFILAGSVLIETIFAWPGMGQLTSIAILSRDYPVILGVFTITVVGVLIANTIADILYAVVDPRVAR
jgi:ABC-type dipeptide/oligopeptide/nickel transport system permease component